MEQMKDIISRIDGIIQEKQNSISGAQAAILENQKVIDEANAAAAAALAAGDENAYVAAKQKAAEGAARLEYNQQRIIKLKEHQPRPDAVEIRRAAMAASVTEYNAIAGRVLELINELVTASDEAAAVVGQYNTARSKWQSYVDDKDYWPDFPDQSAVGIVRNLSFARDNLSAYLGKK
jgi:hypothetical protein